MGILTNASTIASYKTDESALEKSYVLTPENDATAAKWEKQLLSGVGLDGVHTLMRVVGDYGGTSLDVGMSYGAQYFGLRKFYPKVIWSGVDICQKYIDKFRARLAKGENPTTYVVNDYAKMKDIADASYTTVTARSVLSYYSPENAFKIIDEMLRIAERAVIIKFYRLPSQVEDEYREAVGNRVGRGYFVDWARDKWDSYLSSLVGINATYYPNAVERAEPEGHPDFGTIPADEPVVQVVALEKP